MGLPNTMDDLYTACYVDKNQEACRIIRGKTPLETRGMQMAQGGLLEDSARSWKMESSYPEFQKGEASRLTKSKVPLAQQEEKFMYSPLKTGYAEGGEVENFMDSNASMLQPEVPLNFEDDMMMEEDMDMDMDIGTEETSLSAEQEEILGQAMSDYPELEDILDILGSETSVDEFTSDGPVDGPGTETSDSIPAMLSDGEFVFTAKSVKQLGVDKLRKMMSKAEMDYDEGEAKQDYAQMGDEGFAAGGYSLMKRPKYEEGGKIRTSKTGPAGKTYSSREISDIVRQLGIDEEQFSTHIVRLGNGKFKIKNLDLSQFGFNRGGPVDKHIFRNQTKETLGQKAIRIGKAALDSLIGEDSIIGGALDKTIDAWNTPSSSLDPDTDYEGIAKMKADQEFIDRNRAEANAQRKADSILDRKGKMN